MKRAVKILVGAVIGLAVAGAGSVFLLDPDAMIASQRDRVAKLASDELGRALTVGDIEATFLPELGGTVKDVKLAGAEGAQPQVEIGELTVGVSFWRALLSLGKDVQVTRLRARDVHLRASRDDTGTWDFQDILDRQPPSEPSDTIDLSFLEGANVARLALENTTVTLNDAALGRPLTVRGTLEADDVRIGSPLAVSLKAELVDGDKKSPVSARLEMKDVPQKIDKRALPELTLDLNLADLAVGAWGSLLSEDALRPAAGDVALQASVVAHRGDELQIDGKARAKGLVLEQQGAKGRALDLETRLQATFTRSSGAADVEAFELKGSGADVKAKLKATAVSLVGIEQADVDAKVADLAAILGAFPPGVLGLPDDLTLEGPFAARMTGNAQTLDLTVSLDDARVAWADAFDKPRGRKLQLALKGTRKPDRLSLEPFSVQLDAAKIDGALSLPTGDGPFEAKLASGAVSLASLQEVVPPFKNALARGERLAGTASFELIASAQGKAQKADAKLTLDGLDLQLEGLEASGRGGVTVALTPQGETIDARVVADLSALSLTGRGAEGGAVLDKPAGVPLDLDFHVVQSADAAEIKKGLLRMGATKVAATGTISGVGTSSTKLDLDLGQLDVAFDDLRKTVPGASSLPAGGTLKGRVAVRGPTSPLSKLGLDAQALDIAFGQTRVRGSAKIDGLEEPVLDVSLSDVDARFDDLRALTDAADVLPAGGRFGGVLAFKGDMARPQTVEVKLKARRLELAGSSLAGDFSVRDLDRPSFAFDLKGDEVDVDRLLAAFDTSDGKKKTDDNPHGLSTAARKQLAKTSGKGTITARSVVFEGLPMTDFVGKLTMTNGKTSFEALDFTMYGGRVSAAGTSLDLPAEYTGYSLKLAINKMDIGAALTAHTTLGEVFRGALTQDVDVAGRGLAKADLVKTLTGPVALTTRSLTLAGLDVLGAILKPLQAAAKKTPGAPKIASAQAERGTTLQDMKGTLMLGAGKMMLQRPLKTKTSFGALSFEGGSSLDTSLDFTAVAEISPATVSQWTGGKVKPKAAIGVPLKIGGTWAKPAITGVDVARLLQEVLGAAAGAVVDDVKAAAAAEAKAATAKAQAEASKRADAAKAEAEKRAADAKKRADKAAADAKKKADAAKKKAEKEAKKRARDAKKKAEKEAKKRARDAKKKAEEEAKKLLGF
jgi:hypothetical protein